MTPYELRELADARRYSADLRDAAADRLRVIANAIRGLLTMLAATSRGTWQGPAATEFENSAESHNGEVNRKADVLDAVADSLNAEADALRSDAEALDAEAAQIEAEAAAAAAAEAAAAEAAAGSAGSALPPTNPPLPVL